MDYNTLLDLATDVGYELAMSGAETYRIEESISRILQSYGVEAEVFSIPNMLIVSITTDEGKPITRMRRIGFHGNDLDSVECFSSLSRALCGGKPEPKEGLKWLEDVRASRRSYPFSVLMLGYFLGGFGFALLFGGGLIDSLWGGVCGILVGLVDRYMNKLKANAFFRTIIESFLMALLAYNLGSAGLLPRPDAAIIGALMLLVPGLLFTNAMRDIIYGDTNSGVNRIVQVILIAMAIALGTAAAWSATAFVWHVPANAEAIAYGIPLTTLFTLIGCYGFSLLFNIHGPGGILCALGGLLTWLVYCLVLRFTGSELAGYFWGALFASVYSEIMARIRKYPAISYLVVSMFPLIPGAGVYYTMNHMVQGQMDLFVSRGIFTASVAGIMAVGVLLGSTMFRIYSNMKYGKK